MPVYRIKEELIDRKNAIANSSHPTPATLEYVRNTIAAIYPNNEIIWHYAGTGHHFSKLAEEVAEIHEAISGLQAGSKPLSAVSDEIADVLAWMVSAWHTSLNESSLTEAVIGYFYLGCPVCHRTVCTCKPYSGRPDNLIDAEMLRNLAINLEQLVQTCQDPHRSEINELRLSVDEIIKTQDDPVGRVLLFQISRKLRAIRDYYSQTRNHDDDHSIALIDVVLSLMNRHGWGGQR